jgi:uncharacterized protein
VKSRLLTDGPPQQYAVVLDTDDEFQEQMAAWSAGTQIEAATFTAVGGFSAATLGYFDVPARGYVDIPVEAQVEVLVLAGDISRSDGGWTVHAHAVCGRRDGSTIGGHVLRGVVRPTLEVIVTSAPTALRRRHDETVGLALIDLE